MATIYDFRIIAAGTLKDKALAVKAAIRYYS